MLLEPRQTSNDFASEMQVQGNADRTAITPQHNASGTEKKDRTPHVRFCTPAVEATKIPKTPVHSRSSNAGKQDAVLISRVSSSISNEGSAEQVSSEQGAVGIIDCN